MKNKHLSYFSLVLSLSIAATSQNAAGATPVFLDGFESGDLCSWQGSCLPPADVAGTWIGDLAFPGGVTRTIAVQLHQRNDGDLIGYLLGSTESWVVRSGTYAAGTLDLELALQSPSGDRIIGLSGPIEGGRATLTLTGDLPAQAVDLVRWPATLVERRFDFADNTGGVSGPHFVNMAVVLDEAGHLVAGSWSGTEQKPPWGRDGGVTAFSTGSGTVTFHLDLDGGCSAGSVLNASYEPSYGLYAGTFNVIDCSGSQPGTLIGSFLDGTDSDDVAEVLSALATVADQVEAGVSFASPHPSFADAYHHDGTNLAGLFVGLADEMAAWNDIDFAVFDISRIATHEEPGETAILSRPLGVDFQQIRSGSPVGGGARQEYLDSRSDVLAPVTHGQLGVIVSDAGSWKINGNQQPPFDLPWISAPIQPGDRQLEAATPGDPINVSLGGYGGHFSPVAGHAFGDRKANFVGFLPADESELDELAGDGIGNDDGTCSPAEFEAGGCAYWAALDGSLVRQRTPWYVAPQDGVIYGIKLASVPPSNGYFDNVPQWEVSLALDSGVKLYIGHVGRIDDDVALAVLAETGCDPRDWESCDGVGNGSEILLGFSPIPVNAGDPIAQPQVFADEVPGYPGYRVGGGGFPEYPWAQMEFRASVVARGRLTTACVFGLMDSGRSSGYLPVMEADMADPLSQRYRPRFGSLAWAWRAEAALCNSPWEGVSDFSSLATNLGGWYERTDAGTVSDELVTFAPIAMETGLYDPSSYQPGTETLIRRQRAFYDSYFWEMPDASVIEVWEPTGELLEKTTSSLLVLWRDIGWVGGDVYQAAAYRLDQDGLTIEWGSLAATSAAALAVAPTLGPAEPCDETTVLCYDHQEQPGY